jgi:hypothetical protein
MGSRSVGVTNTAKVTRTQKKLWAYLILPRLPTIGVTILGLVEPSITSMCDPPQLRHPARVAA